MREIILTRDKTALVDDEDYEFLSRFKWNASKQGRYYYARTNVWIGKKRTCKGMHQVLLRPPKGMMVDHINGNTLDYRRENLRICLRKHNRWNQHFTNNPSGYKGVFWHSRDKKWQASIGCDGRQIWLGFFQTKEEAAQAYDDAARKYFGEFAQPNFKEVPA